MYPELMFNEHSIFKQIHAKSENGFIVLLLRGMCVCVCGLVHFYFVEASVCVRPVFTRVHGVPDKCIY